MIGLRVHCEQGLISKLNAQTAVHYRVLAHLHSAPQLLEASLKFLVSRKTVVGSRSEWKELMKTYPDLHPQNGRLTMCRFNRLDCNSLSFYPDMATPL
jgi:hypothetical protein